MSKLLCAVVLIGLACGALAAADIDLNLRLKKTAFEVGEQADCELVFTNTTHRDAVLFIGGHSSSAAADYHIDVTDESGNKVSWVEGLSAGREQVASTTIAPGKTATVTTCVNRWSLLSQPGTFTAKAWWRPRFSPWPPYGLLPDTADVDKSESRAITVTIVPATAEGKDSRLNSALEQLRNAKTTAEKNLAVRLLGYALDPRASEELVKAAGQGELSTEAYTALVRFLKAEGVPGLRESVAEALLSDLRKNGPSRDKSNMFAAFKVPPVKLCPVLEEWLKKGKVQHRADALLTLSMLDRDALTESVKPLIASALSDDSPSVRRYALLAVGSARLDDTMDHVIHIIKTERDFVVKGQAVLTLGEYRDDRAIATLLDVLRTQTGDVALSAVAALETIGSEKAEATLRQFASDNGNMVQQSAAAAVERIASKREKAPKE